MSILTVDIMIFCIGTHHLPIEVGRHLQLSWIMRVCRVCCLGAMPYMFPLPMGPHFRPGASQLQQAAAQQRQAHMQSLSLDPRSAPSASAKLCTYHRWFSRPEGKASATYWDVPMSNSKLHRVLRFRMGAHHLPIQMGRHLRLPRGMRVCHMCHSGAICDERHVLMECSALLDLRVTFAPLIAEASGIMARLVWADDQPLVSKYIIACLNRAESH